MCVPHQQPALVTWDNKGEKPFITNAGQEALQGIPELWKYIVIKEQHHGDIMTSQIGWAHQVRRGKGMHARHRLPGSLPGQVSSLGISGYPVLLSVCLAYRCTKLGCPNSTFCLAGIHCR